MLRCTIVRSTRVCVHGAKVLCATGMQWWHYNESSFFPVAPMPPAGERREKDTGKWRKGKKLHGRRRRRRRRVFSAPSLAVHMEWGLQGGGGEASLPFLCLYFLGFGGSPTHRSSSPPVL